MSLLTDLNISTDKILISGADSKDFFHRLTTLNFKFLNKDLKTTGFFLHPTGKIRSVFMVTKKSDAEYLFEIPKSLKNDWKSRFLSTIDQFTFSEDLTISELNTDLNNEAHSIPKPNNESERIRIESLTPNFETEIIPEEVNPLELGLQNCISENKGCYPGQEVIEKIISLGSPARKLSLLKYKGNEPTLNCPTSLSLDGIEMGTLTSFSNGLGLALLKKNAFRDFGDWTFIKTI